VAPHAVDAALRLLGVIAARGAHVRARDIRAAEFRAAIADRLIDAAPPPARAAAQPLGLHPLRDGSSALGLALAFGHADAATLTALVAAAREAGAQGLRTAPGRALLLVGLALEQAPALAAAAEKLGFVVRADDPSRHIAACAGAPVCASAAIPTRTLAPLLFDALAPLLDGSLVVHLSGCSKGCAHARAAALTIVGTPDACAVTLDGLARDTPSAFISADTLPSRLADLGQAVARQRRPGDSAADALRRLGAPGVVAVLQDPEA
jgi:precorrin-3B synthase